jgi:hypothetical protein
MTRQEFKDKYWEGFMSDDFPVWDVCRSREDVDDFADLAWKLLEPEIERFKDLAKERVEALRRVAELSDEVLKYIDETRSVKKDISIVKDDNTRLVGLLFLHRRFHDNVGCPGGDECYVCKEDND